MIRKSFLLLLFFSIFVIHCENKPSPLTFPIRDQIYFLPPDTVLVAFFGDNGMFEESHRVLNLVKSENAELIVLLGDFGYEDIPPDYQADWDIRKNPDVWDEQVTSILGKEFPIIPAIGNHDVQHWRQYQNLFSKRLVHTPEVNCTGDLGYQSTCSYKSLDFIISGIATLGEDQEHLDYIKNQLAQSTAAWKICAWHIPSYIMHTANQEDTGPNETYEICKDEGAIIATAHQHSYLRSYVLDNFTEPNVVSYLNNMHISKGKTFAFISGLGGRSVRVQDAVLAQNPWWAVIYSYEHKATHGVLFCKFSNENPKINAYCYFKNIDGLIIDDFYIVNEENL